MIRYLFKAEGVDHNAQRMKDLNPHDTIKFHNHAHDEVCNDECHKIEVSER